MAYHGGMRKRAAKYRRISQDREGRELGIQRQDEDLAEVAQRRGLSVVADYVDNDSGASRASRKPRPGYQQMLAAARTGAFDVILAYTTGRLTRRPREFEDLIDLSVEHGIEFVYVRSPEFDLQTAQGRRIARTLAAQDAGEAEEIAERVSRAARQRAENGQHHGGARCFGYTTDGLHLEPAEAATVSYAAEQFLSGVPLAAIAKALNGRGVPPARGGQWKPGSVRDMLRWPRHAGLSVHQGKVVGKGKWPPILSEDVHHAVVAMLADPSRRTSTGNRAAFLLSGIGRCGVCGQTIMSRGHKAAGRPGGPVTKRRLYRCRRGCVGRRMDWVDDWVTAHVLARLSSPDAADLLADRDRPDMGALRAEAAAIRVELDAIAAAYGRRTVSLRQLEVGSADLNRRLEEIEALQAHTSREPVLRGLVGAADVAAVWESLPLDRRRAVVQVLVEVTVLPGGSGRRQLDPSTVLVRPKA